MAEERGRREFRRESFTCVRDWVHFCVEFDLRICRGCRQRARISIGAPDRWECRACAESGARPMLPLHPDLWRALVEGASTETLCPVCRSVVALRDCWISPDARRLYCARHLRPIETADRYRRAAVTIEAWRRGGDGVRSPERSHESIGHGTASLGDSGHGSASLGASTLADRSLARAQLAAHFFGDRCSGCPHNGRAIYEEGRLVEIDPDRRHCTSIPDALNCADIEH